MSKHMIDHDQENRHPNRPRIQVGDIDKISTKYVLEGETLRVKNFFESHFPKHREEDFYQEEQEHQEEFNQQEFHKLQYLEKMNVLNQKEKQKLNAMREFKYSQEEMPQTKQPEEHPVFNIKKNPFMQGPQRNYLQQRPQHPYQSAQGQSFENQTSFCPFNAPFHPQQQAYQQYSYQQDYSEENYN